MYHTTLVAFVNLASSRQEAQALVMSLLPRESINTAAWDGSNLDCWWLAEDDRIDGSDTESAVFIPEGDPKGLRMKQADVRLLLDYMQAHDYSPMDVECILRDRDEHYADARAEEVSS
jgi:hypothetical protein